MFVPGTQLDVIVDAQCSVPDEAVPFNHLYKHSDAEISVARQVSSDRRLQPSNICS